MASEKPGKSRIHAPKGTRDVYPEDMLRRRYIQKVWRDCSIRHGFEEIDGPMFEQAQLYAVKSGEGILGELFQAYSGKSPEEVEQVKETGRAPFAMRPEFTPTLARMYAERARQLPKPVKWFSIGPFFRAERPQRGRLREFLQWNCDVIGLPGEVEGGDPEKLHQLQADADAASIEVMAEAVASLGLDLGIAANDRRDVERGIRESGADPEKAFALLDKRHKIANEAFREEAMSISFDVDRFDRLMADAATKPLPALESLSGPARAVADRDDSIVRGLAYYTGTVFELIAEGERSVAGGGRYDNLIELVGGPPTPAVGFAMGDVVLGILLEEKGLMPEGQALRDALSRPPTSLRPEAFVVTPDPQRDRDVRRLVAGLRRGTESEAWRARDDRKPWDEDRYEPRSGGVPPLHARASAKSTRKISKLLAEAAGQFARFAVIIESDRTATVKDLDLGEDLQRGVDLEGVSRLIGSRCSA